MSTLTPRQRRRLGAGGPGALLVAPILVLAFLYLPVAVVIVYSLNSKRSFASFGELSLRWYGDALGNTAMWASALVSVRIALIAVVGRWCWAPRWPSRWTDSVGAPRRPPCCWSRWSS